MKTVTINVTQEHIGGGYGLLDPITRALRAGGYPNAMTTMATWFPDEDKPEEYPLPDAARDFLAAWVDDEPLKPATFELPLE